MNKKLKLLSVLLAMIIIVVVGMIAYKKSDSDNMDPLRVKFEDVTSWKMYQNKQHGFEFKYPEIYNVLSYDSATGKYSSTTLESNEFFVTNATEHQINTIGREYSGIWITISDKKIDEPANSVSESEIYVGGNKGVRYEVLNSALDIKYPVIIFENHHKYFSILESSGWPVIDSFVSSFKFTN
ncbi:MAG: hypothetical protein AAB381_03335 [Patescibacteria group bacterium]